MCLHQIVALAAVSKSGESWLNQDELCFLQKAPKSKNVRQKVQIYDEDDPNPNPQSDAGMATSIADSAPAAPKITPRPPKGRSTPLMKMSFADDEEAENFTVKKPTTERKRMMKANVNRDLIPERKLETTSSYTAEALRSLRESQKAVPPRTTTDTDEYFSSAAEAKEGPLTDGIPDASVIQAARKAREQKRAAAANAINDGDFISLSESTEVGKHQKAESRLVTEEQELEGEETFEDYEGDHITFGGHAVQVAQEKRHQEMVQNVLEAQVPGGEDEQVLQWEEDQIRKGVKGLPRRIPEEASSRRQRTSRIPTAIVIPSITDVCARLNATLLEVETLNQSHTDQLNHVIGELEKSNTALEGLQTDLVEASSRYTFFQDLRTYIGDFAEFLDEKFTELEVLENEFDESLRVRYLVNNTRTRLDLDHWFASFTSWNAPIEVEQQDDPPTEHIFIEQVRIRSRSKRLFDDVSEEFRSLPSIKKRFEQWRRDYPTEYENSYGGLSMPGVFELFVRQELLAWDPKAALPRFEDMNWHSALVDYGHSDDPMEDVEDEHLLTRIVEKVVIPRIKSRIAMYDVYSWEETLSFYGMAHQCLDYVDAGGPAFQGLIGLIETRLSESTTGLAERYNLFLTRMSSEKTMQAVVARTHFVEVCFQLFRAVLKWSRFLARSSAKSLAIDTLLSRLMLPIIRANAEGVSELSMLQRVR
ncbi:nineteen complex-related protein 2-domain-containing protein [Gaertneriomyces semiglobifer]|nr:nineteen complex-related protein 2-domain-containing protein [Gaertneriomyces semiglobifer]